MNTLTSLSSQYPAFVPASKSSNSSSNTSTGASQSGPYRTVSVYVSETVSEPVQSSSESAASTQTSSQPVTWSETGTDDFSSVDTAKAMDLLNALIQARTQLSQNSSLAADQQSEVADMQRSSTSSVDSFGNSQSSLDPIQITTASNPYTDAYTATANAAYSPLAASSVSAYA